MKKYFLYVQLSKDTNYIYCLDTYGCRSNHPPNHLHNYIPLHFHKFRERNLAKVHKCHNEFLPIRFHKRKGQGIYIPHVDIEDRKQASNKVLIFPFQHHCKVPIHFGKWQFHLNRKGIDW